MASNKISSGVVHVTPPDIKTILTKNPNLLVIWEDISSLARNEWICWIESAKKLETRNRRIAIMQDKFKKGERRPCCWAGCPHR